MKKELVLCGLLKISCDYSNRTITINRIRRKATDHQSARKMIERWTVGEFRRLPHRKWDEKIEFDSMVILPAQFDWIGLVKYKVKLYLSRTLGLKEPDIWEISHLHDSGFRMMDFVAIKDGEAVCLLSGCSDVIHIDGIGGFGKDWFLQYGDVPKTVRPSSWMVDCLPVSGLLRMWASGRKMTCGPSISSFEIYALGRRKN